MPSRLEHLTAALQSALGDKLVSVATAFGEVTAVVKAGDLLDAAAKLRDAPDLGFEQLIDLCGVDYRDYGEGLHKEPRFAVVYQDRKSVV